MYATQYIRANAQLWGIKKMQIIVYIEYTHMHTYLLDTGQKILNGCPKAYFFKAYTKVKNPKVGSFLRAPEDLEGVVNGGPLGQNQTGPNGIYNV